ncbi:nuclear transport factor 2 family protein [Novosphingobium beihaiensis]|uniref:Nuclear transport factor 2 family protein n=1 Tax=Novosphingobium beihaiensis TaxID=2930389 RepID=A0ABT0BN94_9SPHN|nr:nuclear transport factor 2 family protein [Novosphingobium beihaiensis]MCJ2186520.1 nuclear transport factor 2 family protein [Novosphingobium beihaiensis]
MPRTGDVMNCEERLRAAMIAGDVEALDDLIDDDLVFTGPMGNVMTKAEDLEAHRSGAFRIQRLDLFDSRIHPLGEIVIATTKAELEATFGGDAVSGTFAYTRVWRESANGWRVLAGHCSSLGAR